MQPILTSCFSILFAWTFDRCRLRDWLAFSASWYMLLHKVLDGERVMKSRKKSFFSSFLVFFIFTPSTTFFSADFLFHLLWPYIHGVRKEDKKGGKCLCEHIREMKKRRRFSLYLTVRHAFSSSPTRDKKGERMFIAWRASLPFPPLQSPLAKIHRHTLRKIYHSTMCLVTHQVGREGHCKRKTWLDGRTKKPGQQERSHGRMTALHYTQHVSQQAWKQSACQPSNLS